MDHLPVLFSFSLWCVVIYPSHIFLNRLQSRRMVSIRLIFVCDLRTAFYWVNRFCSSFSESWRFQWNYTFTISSWSSDNSIHICSRKRTNFSINITPTDSVNSFFIGRGVLQGFQVFFFVEISNFLISFHSGMEWAIDSFLLYVRRLNHKPLRALS